MPTKAREWLTQSNNGVHTTTDLTTGQVLNRYVTDCSMVSYQRTISEGHPWKRGAKWKKENIAAHLIRDMGGPFETRKIEVSPQGSQIVSLVRVVGGVERKYEGPFFPYYNQKYGKYTDIQSPSSDPVLDALGSTAISRVLPTNPLSGIGQFAAELRELPTTSKVGTWLGQAAELRSLKRLKKRQLLKRGSEDWLNFQFGWLPFVKDLKEFFETARDSTKHINQLVRDSGKGVRRKFGYPPIITTVVTEMGNGYGAPSIDSYLVVAPGKLTKTVTTTTHRWFSGSFTYYLPKDSAAGLQEALAHRLYGLRLDIDLIWKIAPWTWAADWVTNFGDVVRNVAAFSHDGLVMRYGYMMESTVIKTEYALIGLELYGTGKINLSQSFVTTTKKRRKATPYGFGFDPGTFNARQWSIIAALGISRAPRRLVS